MGAQAAQAAAAAQTPDDDRRLHGTWLLVARLAWVAVALLTSVYCVAGFREEFTRLQSICTAGPCPSTALDTANLRELAALGRSVDFFATCVIAVELLFALVSFVVGVVIFWRKSNERMALFVALMLVTFGSLAFAYSFDTIASQSGGWWWVFAGVFFLGNISPVLFFFVFPTGRFAPGWMVAPATLLVVLGVVVPLLS